MKNKNAIIFLIIGSGFWILTDLYWLVQSVINRGFSMESGIISILMSFLNLIIPISFLVFGISMLQSKNESVETTSVPVPQQPISSTQNMTIGDWLVTFLITLIPLGGLVALILWSTDTDNKVRKNWAIASLIYQGILLVLFFILFVVVFISARNSRMYY
jgi:hypothetical protein